ncbi:MAG: hypothetical protein AAF988_02805 [Pseudomonadota bacterium]
MSNPLLNFTTFSNAAGQRENRNILPNNSNRSSQAESSGDLVNIAKTRDSNKAPLNQGTRLVSEITEELENGFIRKQQFERPDGRVFTRIEEFTVEANQTRREVTQENPSGSTTVLEDIFDRQSDGSFRLTQRFTNEVGETSVNISLNKAPPSADSILGRSPRTDAPPAYQLSRGNEVDLVT